MQLPNLEQKYSYADYLTWDESERWEIIDGTPHMQATPSRAHQEVLMELSVQIHNYLKGKSCKVYPAPFCVRLDLEKSDNDIKNVVEPDITIVCDTSKLDKRGCKGSPEMIIEILSPSTAKLDKIIKLNKYEQAGVQEYWIVEPDQRLVNVFTLDSGKYNIKIYSDEDKVKVSIFQDLEIDLNEVFPAVEEEESR